MTSVQDPRLEDVLKPLRVGFQAFNDRDMAAFHATWAKEVIAMINEGRPHVWVGEDIIDRWLADSAREFKDDTGTRTIHLTRVLKARIHEDSAFIVLVVTLTTTNGDNVSEEDGVQISNLIIEDGVWKVRALAYGGGLEYRPAPAA